MAAKLGSDAALELRRVCMAKGGSQKTRLVTAGHLPAGILPVSAFFALLAMCIHYSIIYCLRREVAGVGW